MFPEGMVLVPVTGTVEGMPDGLEVEVNFVSSAWLVGPTDDAIVPPFKLTAEVSEGSFNVELPATDDPDWTPTDWTYLVQIRYGNKTVRGTLEVPMADVAGFDLADRINIDAVPQTGITYMPLSLRGAAGGVASLDGDGLIPVEQLPDLPSSSAAWADITGKPATFPPSAHLHDIDDINDLQVQLDGKQPAGVYLVPADIADLVSGETLVEELSDKADLVGGVVPTAQIPAIAVIEYLGASANQAAMLAKAGQKGDWTTRTDLGTVWVITGNDPTQLASWTALTYPTAPVLSVNSQTGAVVLAKADFGLGNVDNTSDANKPVSTAQQTALDAKLPKVSPEIVNTTFVVRKADNSAALQYRSTGGAVDVDKSSGDVVESSWDGATPFTGTQFGLRRWRGNGNTFAGLTEFGSTVYQSQQAIDAVTGVARLGSKNGLSNFRITGLKATPGAPAAGTWDADDVVLDSDGRLWRCTVAGTPGTWVSGIGGSDADEQRFTATGTWTKPTAGAYGETPKYVTVFLIGGGGGGGSGRRGAAATARGGGGGGAGGSITQMTFKASLLPATVTVTIGSGGAGGGAQTTNDANGASGTNGFPTIFGAYARAAHGSSGGGGTTAGGVAGSNQGNGTTNGGNGATGGVTAAGLNAGNSGGPGGGGGGGGISAGDAAFGGGTGGPAMTGSQPVGGVVGGASPGNGVDQAHDGPASGGGGGAASITAAAQAGGNGGLYGAGGGGGGASLNGFNSGAGGTGRPGIAIIVTTF